jgi:hypothetical protein
MLKEYKMTSKQMTESVAFYQLEPYGFFPLGQLTSVVVNMFKSKKALTVRPEHFAIRPSVPLRQKQSSVDMLNIFKSAFGAVTGKKRNKRRKKRRPNG